MNEIYFYVALADGNGNDLKLERIKAKFALKDTNYFLAEKIQFPMCTTNDYILINGINIYSDLDNFAPINIKLSVPLTLINGCVAFFNENTISISAHEYTLECTLQKLIIKRKLLTRLQRIELELENE